MSFAPGIMIILCCCFCQLNVEILADKLHFKFLKFMETPLNSLHVLLYLKLLNRRKCILELLVGDSALDSSFCSSIDLRQTHRSIGMPWTLTCSISWVQTAKWHWSRWCSGYWNGRRCHWNNTIPSWAAKNSNISIRMLIFCVIKPSPNINLAFVIPLFKTWSRIKHFCNVPHRECSSSSVGIPKKQCRCQR